VKGSRLSSSSGDGIETFLVVGDSIFRQREIKMRHKPILVLLMLAALVVLEVPAAADSGEIKSTVAEVVDGAVMQWNNTNFAGFYNEIDSERYTAWGFYEGGIFGTEEIIMTITEGNVLAEDTGVIYTTEGQNHRFDFEDWGQYMTIGFLADEYFAAYVEGSHLFGRSTDANLMKDEQLSKVLMDDDEEWTFTKNDPLKLKEGYVLAIKGIDAYGNIWLELKKDGVVVDSSLLAPSKPYADITDKTYVYKKDMGNTEKIAIIAVHFQGNIFHGTGTSLQDAATVNAIWQISDTATCIKEDTKVDKMTIQTVDADEVTMMITMTNKDETITLTAGKDIPLMGSIGIRTTAETPLSFYLYRGELNR
jgi:S-layer protein (TIGR01567 family)